MTETEKSKYNLRRDLIYQELYDLVVNSLPGTRLPSENALAAKFKVARMTVAWAFKKLERENLIERRKGSGSFVKGVRTVTYFLPTMDCLTRQDGNGAIHRQIMQGLMRGAENLQLRFETMVPCLENSRFKYTPRLMTSLNSGSLVVLTYWFGEMFHILAEKRIRTAMVCNQENCRGLKQYMTDWFVCEGKRRFAVRKVLQLLQEKSCRKIAITNLYPEDRHHPITETYLEYIQEKSGMPVIINLPKLLLAPCQSRSILQSHLQAAYEKEKFDALLINTGQMFLGKNINEYCGLPESVRIFGVNIQKEQVLLENPFPYCYAPYEKMGEDAVELLALSARQGVCRQYEYIFENINLL